jgi:lipopolysaccharide transport system permease protein
MTQQTTDTPGSATALLSRENHAISSPSKPRPAAPFDVVIEAGRTERQYWRDLLRYWELFLILAWRDVSVRYKQTVIGVAWVVVRPLATTIVLTLVFSRLAGLPSESPYPLLVMAAMLPWQLFSNSLTSSCASLVSNSNLITKVYFPRLIIPLSSLFSNLVDFFITAVLMLGLMVYYRMQSDHAPLIGWSLLFMPAFLILCLVFSAGLGLWLGALNVRYRDVQHVVPFIVQFGLYVTPVGYSSAVVPERWRFWFSLNPLVGIVDGFRWCFLGAGEELYPAGILISVLLSALLFATGVWYFRRTERSFADLI